MTKLEELENEAYQNKLKVFADYPFESKRIKGLYCDGTIALNKDLKQDEKACILAEEIGHHHLTTTDIIDLSCIRNRKQEIQSRRWAYNRLIGLNGILKVYKAGCKTYHDMASYLDITEEFLSEALEYYKQKYGLCVSLDNYIIYFEPYLSVLELI